MKAVTSTVSPGSGRPMLSSAITSARRQSPCAAMSAAPSPTTKSDISKASWQLSEALHRGNARLALGPDHGDSNRDQRGKDQTAEIEPWRREPIRRRIEDAGQQLDEHPGHAEAAHEADHASDAEDQQPLAPQEGPELTRLCPERQQNSKAASPVGQSERQDETRRPRDHDHGEDQLDPGEPRQVHSRQ